MGHTKKDLAECKHPNSRKTAALAKRSRKEKRKEELKLGQHVKQNLVGEKIAWFRERLPAEEEGGAIEPDRVRALIDEYLARFDDELEQIALKNSVGGGRRKRQHASREDVIRMTKAREQEEYATCGLEVPDLMDARQVQALRAWNGELRFLQNFKLKRFARKN